MMAEVEAINGPYDKSVTFNADEGGGGKQLSFDLANQYSLPIYPAIKAGKDVGIEFLQDEVRRGLFKVQRGSIFEGEALRTVFARNEKDELTREIDDDTYHPDLLDAVLYAMRTLWVYNEPNQL